MPTPVPSTLEAAGIPPSLLPSLQSRHVATTGRSEHGSRSSGSPTPAAAAPIARPSRPVRGRAAPGRAPMGGGGLGRAARPCPRLHKSGERRPAPGELRRPSGRWRSADPLQPQVGAYPRGQTPAPRGGRGSARRGGAALRPPAGRGEGGGCSGILGGSRLGRQREAVLPAGASP